jgi:hypothetical protein
MYVSVDAKLNRKKYINNYPPNKLTIYIFSKQKNPNKLLIEHTFVLKNQLLKSVYL